MKTPKDQLTEAFTDSQSLEIVEVPSAAYPRSKADPDTRFKEVRELIPGLALILVLAILEGAAVVTFIDRLAHGSVEEPGNVLWVESRNGF